MGLLLPTAVLLALAAPAASAQAGTSECIGDVDQIQQLNGPDLLKLASSCIQGGAKLEGNFLLHAAYLRFGVDVLQMLPNSTSDAQLAMEHASFLMYYVDGPDEAEILRDPESRQRYFGLIDSWRPEFGPDYFPGWNVRRRPSEAEYQAAMAATREQRRQYLAAVAALVSDDTYYRLFEEQRRLLGRNRSGPLPPADEKRLEALRRQLNERRGALGSPLYSSKPAQNLSELPLPAARFPPLAPADDETVTREKDDPVARRCSHQAEWQSAIQGARIVRVMITKSPEWGTIWRADIEGPDQQRTRLACTSNTISSRPLEGMDQPIPPLSDGGAVPR